MVKAWKQWLVMGCVILLNACDQSSPDLGSLKVGIYAVESEEIGIAQAAQKSGKSNGLDIIPVVFKDYSQMNAAVCDGRIDANIFQTLPFLQEQLQKNTQLQQVMQQTNCQLEIIGKTFIYPMGIYSRKVTSLSQVPSQAVVAIPNQPISTSRALLLLQKVGLISLNPNAGNFVTINDIASNPLQLVIVPIIPEQLPSVFAAATLLVVNPLTAAQGGLSIQNSFAVDTAPEYAMLIVGRKSDDQNIRYAELVAAYHSAAVIAEAEKLTAGAAVPAWEDSMSEQIPGLNQ